MLGYPKHLNSRRDYEFVRVNFPPEQWKPSWKELLDACYIWQDSSELRNDEDGARDSTHRVISRSDLHSSNSKAIQQERGIDPQARLFRIGFSLSEVAGAIEE